MSGFGEASFASERLARKGWVGCVWEWQAGERFGWRVMVRLGAVLCGTVMYGLVWLARYGGVVCGRQGQGLAG